MERTWKKDYLRYKDFFLNILVLYNTKPNLRIYLELTLSIVTIIVFSIFAVRPTILTIIDLTKEISAKEVTLTKLKSKIKSLQTASNIMQQETQRILLVDQAVPKKSSPEILIKQIETLASESSLQILGFSISDVTILGKIDDKRSSKDTTKLSNNANELPFTMSARGSYQDIFKFATKLESLRRPIKIDVFNINSNSTEEGKILVVSITGRVPFLNNNNE